MTYRKRRFLFFASALVFLALSGPLLLYTFGYRFSLSDFTLRETGGIFLHTNPTGVEVSVGNLKRSTSFLTGNTFIQNLEPGSHRVTISYPGYQKWEKTVVVEPRAVVELSSLLFPLTADHNPTFIASTTHMHVSPRGNLFLVRQVDTRSSRYNVYDINLGRFLSLADNLSRMRMDSITPEARVYWSDNESAAVVETEDDWIALLRSTTAIRARSLYKHSKLATVIPTKPIFVSQDPTNQAIFYILLDNGNFSRWNNETEILQPLLQSIAGFSVYPTHLLLWDTQSNEPYQTTLQATNARPYATSSIPGITNTRIQELNTHLLLFANNGLWLFPDTREPQLLTKAYDRNHIAVTDAYVIWWDDHTLTIYWTIPEQDMPLYQKERMEVLYKTQKTIRHVAPYPEEPYIVVQEDTAIYTLELDGRGGIRNKHIIYEGTNPLFHIPPNEKIIYILDEGSIFTIELL